MNAIYDEIGDIIFDPVIYFSKQRSIGSKQVNDIQLSSIMINDGDSPILTHGLKRSISPDHLLTNKRKSKTTKIESQKNGGNKENFIKRVQSEMILTKHSSLSLENTKTKSWHQSHRLWSNMLTKTLDKTYRIHANHLDSHPTITTKMRSVLFDWLIEVCEVYHLHRETYQLSISYIDQYLSNAKNLAKNKFQLLGITSLFVAAKIEEIYPPRLADFAYVTDNTCCEEDILDMELDLMNTLNWYINPITTISWILMYLQVEFELENFSDEKQRLSFANSEILQSSKLISVHRSEDFPQTFAFIVRLIDLCSLDIEYSHFSKHILAASAIVLCKSNWSVEKITGLTDHDLSMCQEWMKPFYEVLLQSPTSNASIRSSTSIPTNEVYSIQTHNISMDLLENVYEKRSKMVASSLSSRPFRDLLNNLSWFPTLSEKNEMTVIV